MDVKESEIVKCRICLEENVELHWNELLHDYMDLTYKDCYYKYTQLEFSDEDNFSPMLCRNCADTLEYIDTFISKAIKTQEILKQSVCINITRVDEESIKNEADNVETILEEETEIKPDIENQNVLEESCIEFVTIHADNISNEYERSTTPVIKNKPARRKTKKSKISTDKIKNFEETNVEVGHMCVKKQRKPRVEQTICSICSKVLASKYKAIMHEKTHNKNRERNETCDQCGLKFFSKNILKSHLLTHSETREKAHKCEFCDKAFHYKGGLNVHRRIHLGQMISCSFCSKEFYRQIDLDQHMVTHSATSITSDIKRKKRWFVRCEICGETIRSTSYKSHTAKHMNEPLFKCSLCNKEFFARGLCAKHLRKVHKKSSMDDASLIIAYKSNRLSALFFRQNADLLKNDQDDFNT